MCEIVSARPINRSDVGFAVDGTTVIPADRSFFFDRQSLDEIYWHNFALQCLEPEGWQDLPYPAPDEQVLVPPSTELRLRPVLPLGVLGA